MPKTNQPSPNKRVFEYEVRQVSLKDWDLMNPKEVLNKFGLGGWELCTRNKIQVGDAEMWELIFKREK